MIKLKRNDYIIYGVGVFLVVIGSIVAISWPQVYNTVRQKNLELTPTSPSFEIWRSSDIPFVVEIFMFNWTNAQEFRKNKKVKPKFEEVGPFTFEERDEKVNIVWEDDDSVSFNQSRKWVFVANESYNLKTPITNLNVVVVTVADLASSNRFYVKALIEFLAGVYRETLIITKPTNEWLFDGMNDKLLDFITKFVSIPYTKFGWFFGRNLSSAFDGRFKMKTGRDSIYDLGTMISWTGKNETSYHHKTCKLVSGSSPTIFAPLAKLQKNLSVFLSDFCSAVTLDFSGIVRKNGLSSYRFVGGDKIFDNGTKYHENDCFCKETCYPSGVRVMTFCRKAPLFVSYPHFYLADPKYRNDIEGMHPNQSEHESFLDLEPNSGVPLDVRVGFQVNVHLKQMKDFEMFRDVPDVFIPAFWFRQRLKTTDEFISKVKTLSLFWELGLGLALSVAISGIIVIIGRVLFVRFHKKHNQSELLTNFESEDESRHG